MSTFLPSDGEVVDPKNTVVEWSAPGAERDPLDQRERQPVDLREHLRDGGVGVPGSG
jgi:hypothetical protein